MALQSRSNINIPELPLELWLHIFRLATWVPDILDPDLAIIISPSAIQVQRKALKKSRVTKRRLVRVCKTWHSLALPFLWESIYIDKSKVLNTLCDTLRQSRGKHCYNGSYECTLGWWTRYINIFIRDSTEIIAELQLLEEIFRNLPNLIIINFGFNYCMKLPAFILRSIAETCGTCLQAITWSTPQTLTPDKDDWSKFLSKLPNIRTIHCPIDRYIDSWYPGAEAEAPELLHLKSLCVSSPIYQTRLSLDTLPSLRHLTLGGKMALRPILEKYGSRLETVQLNWAFNDSLPSNISILISKTCPHLSRLNVSVSYWGMLGPDFILPKSLEVFGIQCGRRIQASRFEYKSLFDVLCNLDYASRLRVIQIIDRATVRDLRERHRKEVIKFTERLKTIGLELHDHEGGLL